MSVRLGAVLRTLQNRRIVEVVVAYSWGWAMVLLGAYRVLGRLPSASDLVKADSHLYISIATDGYLLVPCTPDLGPAGQWCGNAGWLPLYPATIRGLGLFGVNPQVAAVAIAAVFALLVLALIARGLSTMSFRARVTILAAAAVFPGAVWIHAAFPMGMVLCFGILAMTSAMDAAGGWRSVWFANGWLVLAMWTHSSAFVFVLCVALIWAADGVDRVRRLVFLAVSVAVSLATWMLLLQVTVGRWDAWFLTQSKYQIDGQGIGGRLTALARHLAHIARPDDSLNFWQAANTVCVLVLLAIGLAGIIRMGATPRQRIREGGPLVLLALMPFAIGGAISVTRNETQLTTKAGSCVPTGWPGVAVLLLLSLVAMELSQVYFLGFIA